jgi:DNA ligase-1
MKEILVKLERITEFVEEANASNSSLAKMEVVERYPDLKELFIWVYSPFIKFNITSKQLKKRKDLTGNNKYLDLEALLSDLSTRSITGHEAIAAVNDFISRVGYEEIIYSIIDKNLKTRTDAKLINKVFPGLVPTFDVALANKYDDHAKKIDFEKQTWYASRKLDGVRCIAIPSSSGYTLFSRVGKEFITLQKVVDDLNKLNAGYVFDGEICIVDEDGNEHFDGVMKEIRKKDHTIANPRYKVFDCLTLDEFNNRKSETPFSERYYKYKDYLDFTPCEFIDVVEQTTIDSEEDLLNRAAKAVEMGWEGLIIRKDVGYEGKRTNNLLKVKQMHDAEYIVENIESGLFRIISKETGLEIEEEMLARVNVKHKGFNVGVGSGFSIAERQYYFKWPEKIIGKEITVRYFEETADQNGDLSLRFPVVKHIYEEDKRDV